MCLGTEPRLQLSMVCFQRLFLPAALYVGRMLAGVILETFCGQVLVSEYLAFLLLLFFFLQTLQTQLWT